MRTYATRIEAEEVCHYLKQQTKERPIYREFDKGCAIQRCISGSYWDFDACRWDNGCKLHERSEWEKRHDLLTFLED